MTGITLICPHDKTPLRKANKEIHAYSVVTVAQGMSDAVALVIMGRIDRGHSLQKVGRLD